MKNVIEAGNGTPEWETIPDPYLELNVRIAEALGYKVEIQDGIGKAWSHFSIEDAPTEENWIALPDFVSDEVSNAEMLEERGYQFFVVDVGGLWECAFQKGDHVGVTPHHINEALALADALLLVLEHKS